MPTRNGDAKLFDDCMFDVLMYKKGPNPGDRFLVPRLFAWLAGDLERFSVEGGLGKFWSTSRQGWVFVDHRKKGWHPKGTSRRPSVREVSP